MIITNGQVVNKVGIIQVTGIVCDEENNPVPGISIVSHKLRRGTISELSGIYNLISVPGDTIWFTALGYKNVEVIIPCVLNNKKFTKDVRLLNDTIVIKDVLILPWKNYEEFKREVLATRNITPQIINMYENMALIQYNIANSYNFRATPEAGYRYYMQQNANAIMDRNVNPVTKLVNPFAWANFFSGIKNGLLKNRKSDKSAGTKAKIRKKNPDKVK
jgi:hypothetical protein